MKKFNWGSVSSAFCIGLMVSASLFTYKEGNYTWVLVDMGLIALNSVSFTISYFKETR